MNIQTKNHVRKIISVLLVIIVMFGMMSTSVAAESTKMTAWFTYRIKSSMALNVWGDSAYQGSAIRNWNIVGGYFASPTQTWNFVRNDNGNYSLRTKANTTLAINRSSSTGRAILWSYKNGVQDSDLSYSCVGISDGWRYRFALVNYSGSYLMGESTNESAYVKFGSPGSTYLHDWYTF